MQRGQGADISPERSMYGSPAYFERSSQKKSQSDTPNLIPVIGDDDNEEGMYGT
ncbi:hypothetical protein [Bacillus benzoevorans]|uniref:Uncharacterized protein n=1 Tax=Bacillus benzoevorans TaxID=1456 RepID=A0A7X0HSQ8_9BACI|nr:hypothetical protein [Bacillus benzoevorans]